MAARRPVWVNLFFVCWLSVENELAQFFLESFLADTNNQDSRSRTEVLPLENKLIFILRYVGQAASTVLLSVFVLANLQIIEDAC